MIDMYHDQKGSFSRSNIMFRCCVIYVQYSIMAKRMSKGQSEYRLIVSCVIPDLRTSSFLVLARVS